MTLTRAFGAVAAATVVCGAGGAAVGYVIGTYAPATYRAVFSRRAAMEGEAFRPDEIGLGLGLVQGLVAGAVVGVILVAIVAWYETRKLRTNA